MLLPALTVMSALSGLVLWGSSTCPSPRDVAGRLPKDGTVKLQVEVRAGDPVELVLRDEQGRLVATRVLSTPAACDALVAEAAGVVSSWVLAASPPTIRKPLRVGAIAPPPPRVDPPRLELWVSGGVTAGNQPRGMGIKGFGTVAELQRAPEGSGLLASASLGVDGPHQLVSPGGASGQGWRFALGVGGGVRLRIAFVVVDAFVQLPVSMLTPTSTDPAPLSTALQPAMMLGVQAGVRIGGWERRFAPFVRLAVDATLVSTGALMTLPVALSLGAGIAWSGT